MCYFDCEFIDISCQDTAGWSCDMQASYVVARLSTFIFGTRYIKRIKFKFVCVLVNCIKCTSTTWRHSCIETGFTAVKIAFGYTHRTVCLYVIYTEISYNALSHCYTFFHIHGHLNYLLSYGLFTAFRFGRPNHNGFFALGCAFEIHTSCI